ncbi:MAG: glycosyltransferase, partial [Chthoniobacterales bacterium]
MSLLSRLGVGPQFLHEIVHIPGPRGHPSAAADIFLLTSDYEGTPMTLLEAMSSALPCVVSAVDGCQEILGEG